MPSGFSHVLTWGNELYQSPPSKNFTCSSLTSKEYVPLSGALMPIHQDLTPVYQDSMPVHQDRTPVYQDSTPGSRFTKVVTNMVAYFCHDIRDNSHDYS